MSLLFRVLSFKHKNLSPFLCGVVGVSTCCSSSSSSSFSSTTNTFFRGGGGGGGGSFVSNTAEQQHKERERNERETRDARVDFSAPIFSKSLPDDLI